MNGSATLKSAAQKMSGMQQHLPTLLEVEAFACGLNSVTKTNHSTVKRRRPSKQTAAARVLVLNKLN